MNTHGKTQWVRDKWLLCRWAECKLVHKIRMFFKAKICPLSHIIAAVFNISASASTKKIGLHWRVNGKNYFNITVKHTDLLSRNVTVDLVNQNDHLNLDLTAGINHCMCGFEEKELNANTKLAEHYGDQVWIRFDQLWVCFTCSESILPISDHQKERL